MENKPMFSVITPTLQRESLIRCCESVDSQSCRDTIEHIVAVDCETLNSSLMERIKHPHRRIFRCGPFRNFGNTPRHLAWHYATGIMQHVLDDDNYYTDSNVLEDIMNTLRGAMPDWACFPILRFGHIFFSDNPRSCHADTANVVIKREYAQWPNRNEYTCDGIFIDSLRARPELTFKAFGDFRPIVVLPQQGKGEF